MDRPTRQLRRRNHFVPASYLAAFTVEKERRGRVWVYVRADPSRPKLLHLNSVGLEKDLYIRIADGEANDEIERFLADSVEGPFTRVLRGILQRFRLGLLPSAEALTAGDRTTIARFMAYQLLRTPNEREMSRWLGELSTVHEVRRNLHPAAELGRSLAAASGGSVPEELGDALLRLILDSDALKSRAADWLPRTCRLAEKYSASLERLEWRLIPVAAPVELVTCDIPLVCVRRGARPGTYTLGGAITDPAYEATLALTPWLFLLVTHHVEDERAVRTREFARSIRQRTIEYAHIRVYARSSDSGISRALAGSEQPNYHDIVDGCYFPVGHPVLEIEQEIRRRGVTHIQTGYGVPGSRTHSPAQSGGTE